MCLRVCNSVLTGGGRSNQVLDIVCSGALVIEQGLDDKSQGPIAQMDIQKLYDPLDVFLIVEHFVRKATDGALVHKDLYVWL